MARYGQVKCFCYKNRQTMFFSKDKAIENIKTAAVSRWVKFGIVGLIILAFVGIAFFLVQKFIVYQD